MKFTSVVLLGSLSVLVISATLSRRDANTVKSDITTIASQLQTVYNDVQSFQGDAPGALKIQNDANTVANTLSQAAKDAASSSPFSTADSASIASSIAALQPQIVSTLALLVVKKPLFEQAVFGFSAVSLVEQSVQTLKTNTDNFAGNVSQKFIPVVQRLAPLVTGQIDYHYVQTLQAFSS